MFGQLFEAMRIGEQVKHATGLKWAQAITIIASLAYWTAKSFGVEINLDESQLFNVLALVGSVFGLAATFLTSRRVGLWRRRRPSFNYDTYYPDYRPSGIPPRYVPGNGGPSDSDNPFLDREYD